MLDDLKHILESKGIIPSYHRIKIYEFLINNQIHPTADMIYTEMIQHIPSLSKTTIYNTLKIFTKNGLINSITIDDNEVRFDANTTSHGHFKCFQCDKVYDIFFEGPFENQLSQYMKTHMSEYRLVESHFYFKGLCKNCIV